MNNSFLTNIGLGNIDIGIILLVMLLIIIILLVLLIVNICSISKMKKQYKKFMTGKTAKSLEEEIVGLFEDNKFMKASITKNKKNIDQLYRRMEPTFQKIGLVKYDAFNQMGGQLSFCLTLLDENNNGFLINSVHNAEGCYLYSKEIVRGESEITLSEEEKKALDQAIGED